MVTRGVPATPALRAFLEFILTEGQQYATESGYIALGDSLRAAGLQQLQ
jgi:phosphate transport system substrate-binding protein